MRKILETTFKELIKDYDGLIVGNSIILKMDRNRRVEIYFVRATTISCRSVYVKIINKKNGEITGNNIAFSSVFSEEEHPPAKEVILDGGVCKWSGNPSRADLWCLRNIVRQYIEVWR